MAAKSRKFNVAIVVLLGAYAVAALMVLTRPGAALSGDERAVVRIAHWQIEAGPREGIDAMIKRYLELNPHVRVEQVAVPGRIYKQWLRTQLIGGTAPDIIEFGRLFNADDIPPRFFEQISELVEKPNPYNKGTPLEGVRWRDTFKDGLDTPDTYIENLSNFYGVTLCTLSTRLFYNADLMEEISGSSEAPSSFAELRAFSEKLAQHNAGAKHPISMYAGSKFNGRILMGGMLSRAGVGLGISNDRLREQGQQVRDASVDYLRGNWDHRTPELLTGLKLMQEVARNLRPGFQQLERDAAMQEFMRGQAPMIITGTWDATSLTSLAPFKVGVAVFPWPDRSDKEVGQHFWGPLAEKDNTSFPLCVNRMSPHKKETIDFLHFITSVEGNTIFFEKSGWLPATRGVVVPEEQQVYLPSPVGLPVRTPYIEFGAETATLWQRQLYRLVSPQGSVEEFLEVFEKEFPDALKSDLRNKTRHLTLSLRHDMQPLIALAMLDRLLAPDPKRIHSRVVRESSQNIAETRLYEALTALERGLDVGTASRKDSSNGDE